MAVNIARVIGAESSENHIAEFVRRLTFNMLIGNADAHLKNWSMRYPDRRNAMLAPAYDLLAAIAYIRDETAALKVSRTKRFDAFSEDELVHMAARAHLPRRMGLDTARESVARFQERWQAGKSHLPLAFNLVEAVEAHIKQIPLAKPAPVVRAS